MNEQDAKRLQTETFFRSMEVEREDLAREDGRIPVALSSEEPVERWFGREILDHSKGMIDMRRAQRGLPLLLSHDHTVQVGRIEDMAVGKDAKLRGFMRFSQSAQAQEIRQDVLDGIRSDVSVGYRVLEMKLESSDDTGDTYRCKWMPLEGSLVPVPADDTVGVGRAADRGPAPVSIPAASAVSREVAVETPTPSAPASPTPAAPTIDAKEIRSGERERSKVIVDLASRHGFMAKLSEWLASERAVDSIREEILESKARGVIPTIPGTAEDLGLTDREKRGFSVVAAIRQAAGLDEPGFELEVSNGLAKRMGKTPRHDKAFWFPMDLPAIRVGPELRAAIASNPSLRDEVLGMRAGLDSKTTTAGLELKFTEPGSFIELLRNSAKVMQLGATFLPGMQGNVAFPRQTGAGTFSWVAENSGSDVADSNLALDQVTMSPKFGMSTTSYSKNLLTQAVIDVEGLVRSDLALITAIGIDSAAINGTGASNQPKGILTQSGIGSVTLGANGGTVSWNAIVDLVAKLDIANALRGQLAFLTTPGQRAQLSKLAQISATTGLPIWFNGQVYGYGAESSTNVPSNLTKGTSTTICHAIIFANWAELLIAQWNALELVVDPYRLKKQAMIEVTSFVSVDVAVRHAASFAAIVDAL